MSDKVLILIFFLIAGIVSLVDSAKLKISKPKPEYLPLPLNLQVPRYHHYGGIPAGVGSLVTVLGIILNSRIIGFIGICGALVLGMAFMMMKPRWVEPPWMAWLRDHYDWPVLEFMFTQARQDRNWGDKVATQEGLETWAAEMAEMYRSGDEGLSWHSK